MTLKAIISSVAISSQAAALILLSSTVLAANPSAYGKANSSAASACDVVAAFPYDNQRKAPGVAYNLLNPAVAIARCSEAANQYPNEGRLYFQLGRALEKANRLPAAIAAYGRAAQLGHGGGYNNLGELYRDGKGVARDSTRAERLFQEGSSLGYAEAEFNLANLLVKRAGDADTIDKARQLLRKAADSGYIDASLSLSRLPAESQLSGAGGRLVAVKLGQNEAEPSSPQVTEAGETPNSANGSTLPEVIKDLQAAQSNALAIAKNLSSAGAPEISESTERVQSQLDSARHKGEAYAKEVGVAFQLTKQKDEMTDLTTYKVELTESNDSGIEAMSEGLCEINPANAEIGTRRNTNISFTVLVTDDTGKPSVHFAPDDGEFKYRVDDAPAQNGPPGFPFLWTRPKFSNELGPLSLPTAAVKSGWRLLISVDTDHGPLLVKIPLQDPAVQRLAALCN